MFVYQFRFTSFKKDHNQSVEYFSPFGKTIVTFATFAPLSAVQLVNKEMCQYKEPSIVNNIIIAGSYGGRIHVYYNQIAFTP